MKKKFENWWNRPITWGDSVKYSVWGTLISAIGCATWLFGIGWLNKKMEVFKQRTSEDVKEAKKQANYFEVDKDDVEE